VSVHVGGHVFGRDVEDAVRIDVERDLDLRQAAGRRRNAREVEAAERPVIARQRPLALKHVDFDRRLPVGRRTEDLAILPSVDYRGIVCR
jgi:NAD-specific glutamate dehydrogenase